MRTFLAVDIPDALRDQLAGVCEAIDPRDRKACKVTWVAPRNLHVTMQFLGEVSDDQAANVCQAAAEVAGRFAPIPLEVPEVVAVPPAGRRLRMFWAQVADPTGRLAELQRRAGEALAELGFAPESREYRPHVTLGRVKFARSPDALRRRLGGLVDEVFDGFEATGVTVYASELTPRGPIYTPLARCKTGRER